MHKVFHAQNRSQSQPWGLGYGRLYNAFVTNVNSGNLISGLRVPSDTEFTTMVDYVGTDPGHKLREVGTAHWLPPNTSATDEYNFTGVGSGSRSSVTGNFQNINNNCFIWTSTALGDNTSNFVRELYAEGSECRRWYKSFSDGGLIRCMRDLTTLEQTDFSDGDVVEIVSDYNGNTYNLIRIGTQGWTSRNLICTNLNDGTAIPNITDGTTWLNLTTPGLCAYNNDENNV